MTHSCFARSALALLAASAFVACAKSAQTAPTPTASTTTTTTSSTAMAAPSNGLPSGVTLAMVAEGDSIFHGRSCRNCHGMDAKGAQNGPDLTSGHFQHVDGSYESFVRVITAGIPVAEIKDSAHTRAMPARGGPRPAPLTDDQIRAVAAYVYSLSHKM